MPRGRVPGTEIPGREKTEWRPAHTSLSATGPHGPALMVLSQDRPLPAKKWSPSPTSGREGLRSAWCHPGFGMPSPPPTSHPCQFPEVLKVLWRASSTFQGIHLSQPSAPTCRPFCDMVSSCIYIDVLESFILKQHLSLCCDCQSKNAPFV